MGAIFIELLKIILPAAIVALTAYYLISAMLRQQYLQQVRQTQKEDRATTLPLQLQAYERLSLLCERLAIPGLVLRTQHNEMQAAIFQIALLMGIQQEFEHNISQQIYVSDQLWSIIQATRDDAMQFIDLVSDKIDKIAPASELAAALMAYHEKREGDPIATAQMAIRREAASIFA